MDSFSGPPPTGGRHTFGNYGRREGAPFGLERRKVKTDDFRLFIPPPIFPSPMPPTQTHADAMARISGQPAERSERRVFGETVQLSHPDQPSLPELPLPPSRRWRHFPPESELPPPPPEPPPEEPPAPALEPEPIAPAIALVVDNPPEAIVSRQPDSADSFHPEHGAMRRELREGALSGQLRKQLAEIQEDNTTRRRLLILALLLGIAASGVSAWGEIVKGGTAVVHFMRDNKGVAAVELAFILPVLLLLVMGGFNYGFAMVQYQRLTFAAQSAAVCGAIHQCNGSAETITYAQDRANINGASFTANADTCGWKVGGALNYNLISMFPALNLSVVACYPMQNTNGADIFLKRGGQIDV